MTEIPSSYLIDKALKTKSSEILQSKQQIIENRQEALGSMVEGLSLMEESESGGLPIEKLDEQSIQERVESIGDITLTDLEKSVTDKQRKFAWALARYRVSGIGSLTKCALEAGFADASASKEGSKLAKHPVIVQIAKDRMPAEFKLKAVKDRGPDYVIEKTVTILERAMQEVPVLDKTGLPTGHYIFEGVLALRALENLANWMGMTKEKIELSGSKDGGAIKVDVKQVEMKVITMAERVRQLKIKKKDDDVEDV